jgi:Protein of unknown function (DUF3275)
LEIIMMVFKGSLKVESILGRKGAFSVGVLTTEVGQFKIKDAALDQFEPGVYDGEFVITRIYTKGEPWRGGYFTSLMVDVAQDGYHIRDEMVAAENEAPAPAESDPADSTDDSAVPATQSLAVQVTKLLEPANPTQTLKLAESSQNEDLPKPAPLDVDLDAADAKLFGVEIYPRFKNREVVALDATVDRLVFREQRDRLKANAYRFDVATQSWLPPGHANS